MDTLIIEMGIMAMVSIILVHGTVALEYQLAYLSRSCLAQGLLSLDDDGRFHQNQRLKNKHENKIV